MPKLNDINQVRNIEWGKSHLWEIRLDGAPAPFDEWFPATEVQESLATVHSKDFNVFLTDIRIPHRMSSNYVNVTFADDINGTLEKFFREWMRVGMFGEGTPNRGVATLGEATKILSVITLDNKRNDVRVATYHVFPEGELVRQGSSETGGITFSLNFVIVGIANFEYVQAPVSGEKLNDLANVVSGIKNSVESAINKVKAAFRIDPPFKF